MFAVLATVSAPGRVCAQTPDAGTQGSKAYWLTGGVGISSFGDAAGGTAMFDLDSNLVGLRFIYNMERTDELISPKESLFDLALLYGKRVGTSTIFATFSGGISVVSGVSRDGLIAIDSVVGARYDEQKFVAVIHSLFDCIYIGFTNARSRVVNNLQKARRMLMCHWNSLLHDARESWYQDLARRHCFVTAARFRLAC